MKRALIGPGLPLIVVGLFLLTRPGMDPDHMAAWILAADSLTMVWWAIDVERHKRRQRAREIQAARRRHPSARPAMSDRERRYHGSDQWGR